MKISNYLSTLLDQSNARKVEANNIIDGQIHDDWIEIYDFIELLKAAMSKNVEENEFDYSELNLMIHKHVMGYPIKTSENKLIPSYSNDSSTISPMVRETGGYFLEHHGILRANKLSAVNKDGSSISAYITSPFEDCVHALVAYRDALTRTVTEKHPSVIRKKTKAKY